MGWAAGWSVLRGGGGLAGGAAVAEICSGRDIRQLASQHAETM